MESTDFFQFQRNMTTNDKMKINSQWNATAKYGHSGHSAKPDRLLDLLISLISFLSRRKRVIPSTYLYAT